MARLRLLFAMAFALALTAPPAVAGPVYATGFEPPGFTPGFLTPGGAETGNGGQGGWGSFESPAAFSITTNNPRSGTQALRVNGAGLTDDYLFGGLYYSSARRRLDYDIVANGTPVVDVSVGVRLDGPKTDGDLLSANLTLRDGNGVIITDFILSSDGNIYTFDPLNDYAYVTAATAALGEYFTLGVRLNYLTRQNDFFVNGQLVGRFAFYDGAGDGFRGAWLGILAFDEENAPSLDRSRYTAYFDDLEIRASPIPEPASLLAFGLLSAAGLGWAARRRRPLGLSGGQSPTPPPGGAFRRLE